MSAEVMTTVEARGVLCPVPVIRLARVAATLPPGSVIALLSDDPAAEHDVPAWCRLRGHTLLGWEWVGADPDADGAAIPDGPEPPAANPSPGQAMRHLIRVGSGAAEPRNSPTTGGSASASPSSRR